MYETIIVGYDGSDQAEDALALACAFAEDTGGSLILAFAHGGETIPVGIGTAAIGVRIRDEAEAVLGRGLKRVPAGIRATTRALPGGSPARALYQLALYERGDLVVLGSTSHGAIGRVTVGTVADRLMSGLPCSILVAPTGFATEARTPSNVVGVCWNGSPEAELAEDAAIELARATGAELLILTAVKSAPFPYPSYPGSTYIPDYEQAELAEERLAAAVERVPGDVTATSEVLAGMPATVLAERAADAGLDLLVTGSRGYGPVRRVLLGGLSANLVRSAPCPVLVVPRSSAGEASEHVSAPASRSAESASQRG
jgi:nucleotide-binding universal stress UspA family protein